MKNNNFSCIYMIRNVINNNIYVGRTVNFRKRINSYKSLRCKNQPKIYKSLKKYGIENHSIDVITKCSVDELNFWESFYIKIFDSFDSENGLNLTSGGDASLHSEETKNKIGLRHKNKIINDEVRKKMSEVQKKVHKNYTEKQKKELSDKISLATKGIKKSEEWKEKMSKIKTGKKRNEFSQEWKNKIGQSSKKMWIEIKNTGKEIKSRGQIEKHKQSLKNYFKTEKGKIHLQKMSDVTRQRQIKPIVQLSIDGKYIKEWESTADASKALNIPSSNISNCLNGKNNYKSAGGYKWVKK